MDDESAASPLDCLKAFFHEEGLGEPYVPENCRERLIQISPNFWATEKDGSFLMSDPKAASMEFLKNPRMFLATGLSGHGANTWFVDYAYVDDQLLIFSNVHTGALSRTEDEVLEVVERRDRSVRDMIGFRDQLLAKNAWPGDKRLFIVSSERQPEDSGVGWLSPAEADAVEDWHESEDAFFWADLALGDLGVELLPSS